MFNSTNWVGYVSALFLTAVSVAAVFLVPRNRQLEPTLPPIPAFAVDQTFSGRHTFGIWTLACRNPQVAQPVAPSGETPTTPDLGGDQANAPRCNVSSQMTVRREGKNQIVAAFAIFLREPEKRPSIAFLLPPAAKGGPNLLFGVDQNKAYSAPILKCTEAQCVTRGELPAGAVDQLLSGRELRVRFVAPDKREPVLRMMLYGFPEAYAGLLTTMGLPPHQPAAAAAPIPGPVITPADIAPPPAAPAAAPAPATAPPPGR